MVWWWDKVIRIIGKVETVYSKKVVHSRAAVFMDADRHGGQLIAYTCPEANDQVIKTEKNSDRDLP